ncbi:hypothetical protein D3C79_1073100 [compost metagenome]
MVFERAGNQEAAVGEQGAGDAVALQALERLAIEAEIKGLVTVDQQAHRGG